MRYVVELTISGHEGGAAAAPASEPTKSRIETLEIDADNVPEAIQKAKDKFREHKITDVNIRFR